MAPYGLTWPWNVATIIPNEINNGYIQVAQPFPLSARSRTLCVEDVAALSEEQARDKLRTIRWAATRGEPVCPRCGCIACYTYASRPIFKCKACCHQFSVTSGTLLANRKLSVRKYLLAVAYFAAEPKGISALRMASKLGVHYKTAFVIMHKLREAMAREYDGVRLTGEVEVDGAYIGGHVRPANYKKNRRDRRLARNQNGKRRVVVVMRQRGGPTLTGVFRSEDQSVPVIRQRVEPSAVIYADEAPSWDALHASHEVRRINHSMAYSDDTACTNAAESFFSRLRRAAIGHYHHMSPGHLASYATEMAWREDHRRESDGTLCELLLAAAMGASPSRTWAGYWHRSIP